MNKIYKNYKLPSELYYSIMNIISYDQDKNLKEINDFVETLPIALKTKVNRHIYKKTYKKLSFLKNKSDNFITWVCPLLQPM